jgi:hypothetical protein
MTYPGIYTSIGRIQKEFVVPVLYDPSNPIKSFCNSLGFDGKN